MIIERIIQAFVASGDKNRSQSWNHKLKHSKIKLLRINYIEGLFERLQCLVGQVVGTVIFPIRDPLGHDRRELTDELIEGA